MYAYRYVDSADRKPVLPKYQVLDKSIRDFYDKTRNLRIYPSEREQASTFYMWSPGMPLMNYRDSISKLNSVTDEFKKWAIMGPLYKDYGIYIIKKYPIYFLYYFVWPNARKYYAPPVEFLENYNTGNRDVTVQAKKWFGYNSKEVKTRMKSGKTWILDFYPILSGVINLVMLFGVLYYAILKGWQYGGSFNAIVLLGATFWMINAGFTIFASSAALRFQSFPLLLTTCLSLLLIDWMLQLIARMKVEKNFTNNSQQEFSNDKSLA